ncbi:MAG: hypothetical protein JWP03_3029 [Phycisphaerales bacterium]|nr:hypothetical protein [Phycisphaerales bacterium]
MANINACSRMMREEIALLSGDRSRRIRLADPTAIPAVAAHVGVACRCRSTITGTPQRGRNETIGPISTRAPGASHPPLSSPDVAFGGNQSVAANKPGKTVEPASRIVAVVVLKHVLDVLRLTDEMKHQRPHAMAKHRPKPLRGVGEKAERIPPRPGERAARERQRDELAVAGGGDGGWHVGHQVTLVDGRRH